jgi:putative ABC transport system substrate-binding protein
MRRREFISLLGGAAVAWPIGARAQAGGQVRWIGMLVIRPDSDPFIREATEVFERTLEKLGWAVGRNLAIDYRWGVSDLQRGRAAVAQILRLAPDVILANGGPALTAAQQATRTVPIVFIGISEPVERGFVASLARPGGNTTGFTNLEATVGGKWLELFKEMAPRVTRVTIMFNPASSFAASFLRSAEMAAKALAVEVIAAHVRDPAEIDAAMAALARHSGAGLMFPPDGFTPAHLQQLLDLTTRYRLPTMSWLRSFVTEGGLMSYGIELLDPYRRAAAYVDRILRGEKPGDLPVQQPTKFELIINLKSAKALGLEVPPTLLARADEVIE